LLQTYWNSVHTEAADTSELQTMAASIIQTVSGGEFLPEGDEAA